MGGAAKVDGVALNLGVDVAVDMQRIRNAVDLHHGDAREHDQKRQDQPEPHVQAGGTAMREKNMRNPLAGNGSVFCSY